MPKAIYPGSFDPVHNGHVDIARRAAAVFDEVIVAIYQQPPSKTLLFTTEERVQLFAEATVGMPNIRVTPFSGLAPDFARSVGADFILRGLRAGFDFELEFEMALMWRNIAPDIDVVCMMTSLEHQFVYSSRIKEVAQLGANVSQLVPENVANAMREKLSS